MRLKPESKPLNRTECFHSNPKSVIRNPGGKGLGMTVGSYDRNRHPAAITNFKTLCHAPFTSMDFGPQGQINVCNHYFRTIDNIANGRSLHEIWKGKEFSELRFNMLNYVIDEDLCRHCAIQIRTKHPENAFSVEQYDQYPAASVDPDFPSRMTFRLSNRCNLACVMCSGTLSSRIRRERDKQPNPPSPYGDRFFSEIRDFLPRLNHVEFFGGEPFLIREHLRIFDLIKETGAQCTLYANTNCTSLTDRIKAYIEDLNFTCIAVSMDAVNPELHAKIRVGIDHEKFMKNLNWLLGLRKRRRLKVILNVTELRQNWFELPELFRFAARIDCFLHINTCIHPDHCTLYTLPTNELTYLLDFFVREREKLDDELRMQGNNRSYQHLVSMIEKELDKRKHHPRPSLRGIHRPDGGAGNAREPSSRTPISQRKEDESNHEHRQHYR